MTEPDDTASTRGRSAPGDEHPLFTDTTRRGSSARTQRRLQAPLPLVDEGTVEVVFECDALQGVRWEVRGAERLRHGEATLPVREEYDHDARPVHFFDYRRDARAYQGADVQEQVRLRRELQARDARVAEGTSSVVAFRPGRSFELVEHPQAELDGFYVLTHVEHRFMVRRSEGGAQPAPSYVNSFRASQDELRVVRGSQRAPARSLPSPSDRDGSR